MMNINNELFNLIYRDKRESNRDRFSKLISEFSDYFDSVPLHLFSTPGRVELSGNHTDHNHGCVIAASINLDSIAAAGLNNDNVVTIYSEGYDKPFIVDLDNLDPVESEEGNTRAIIRGVAFGLRKYGYNIGGFNACLSSEVLVGSGLSSSASIEVLIGTIFNKLYNDSSVSFEQIAIIGQYAENNFFGKPCGLMDQIACAAGGIVAIDFERPDNPSIKKMKFSLAELGYKLIIVNTGGNHADLTEDYAAIPNEMKKIAGELGKLHLRECDESEFLSRLSELRETAGDRAVLRAIHFFEEDKRVSRQIEALIKNDFKEFLTLVNQSGNSSFKYLQNIYSTKNLQSQGVSIALALSEIFINQIGDGACRINGGGFAGTIEAFIPDQFVEDYKSFLSAAFDSESVKVLSIRNTGSVCLTD
ncbi:MAG: hypothetical protein JW995_12625 [Melioribacteraceae bacterium]|nr:hypothetical protein [Melioribacteraceae bacterium]